jgi:hypothetical protein
MSGVNRSYFFATFYRHSLEETIMIPVYDDGTGNKQRPGGNRSDSSDDFGNTHGGGGDNANSYDGNLLTDIDPPTAKPIGHW